MRSAFIALGVVVFATRAALAGGTVLQQGLDYWHTPAGGASLTFGEVLPPIPPGFFHPGSEPFIGTVLLQGEPLSPTSGNTDTIIRRMADSPPLLPGQPAQIPIELVELNLVSSMPITVQPSNQQWDVRVTFSPTSQTFGQAQVILNTPTIGDLGYQLQFLPTITLTPSGGGQALVYIPPPSYIQQIVSPPETQFTVVPPPSVWVNQGPNLFPTEQMQTAGPGYQQLLVPAAPPDGGEDCNANGMDDAIDLSNGTSLDSNLNGVPDECEISVSGIQYSWPDFEGGYVQRFSQHGALRVTVPEPAAGQIGWFNAVLDDGGWVVQNFPVHEINLQGNARSIIIPVPLPTAPGIAIEQGTVVFTYTPFPLEAPPPPDTLPVDLLFEEHVVNPGLLGPFPGLLPIDPGPIGPFINPFIPIIWETTARRNVPGVDEDSEHCAPGSAARSFSWLDTTYCLDLPDDCDSAQELYDMLRDAAHMDTSNVSGTESVEKMVEGIQQLIDDKGLGDDLTVEYDSDSSGDTVFEALEAGYDVMGIIYWRNADGSINGGHAVTIVGATRCGENVVIDYRDDAHGTDSQGDGQADSDDTKGGQIVPTPGGGHSLGGHGRNTWEGIVKICPTRSRTTDAAMKWVSGNLDSGGSIPGIGDLVQDILDGYEPSIFEVLFLLGWACALEDNACSLVNQIVECGTVEMLDLALLIKERAMAAKLGVLQYFFSGDPAHLAATAEALDADLDAALTSLLDMLDCDGNGVDDKLDLARGDLHDANHDMVPDECQCLADWNSDGVLNVPDIFAFLSDWFAGDADVNGDGVTTVPDIFAFLALWFAGCPD